MDIVDLANETIPQTYGGAPVDFEAPPEKLPDGRTREGRAARGLPPKSELPSAQRLRGPKGPRTAANAPGRKPAPATSRQTKTDYKAGVEGLLQLAAFGLSFQSPMDAMAIQMHAPYVAMALSDLAQVKPEVARVLDKILAAGPYGAVLSAIVPLVVQILVNHNKVSAGALGSVDLREHLAA